MCTIAILLTLCFFTKTSQYQTWKTIYDKINEEPEFSGYRTMIKGNRIIMSELLYSEITVFVPDNTAVERYDGFFTEDLILYHMGTQPYTLKEFNVKNSLESARDENPPLWVTVTPDGYFINNAKIIERRSNYVAKAKRRQNSKQVLHVIDRVLDPMLQSPFTNPSAYDFLQNYQYWKLGSRKVSNFFKRIQFNEKEDIYQKSGGHTFFIPINDNRYDHHLQDIDSYIIEGHVVPNTVLFIRPTKKNFVYETSANGDYIYIVISFEHFGGKNYVKSRTLLGDTEHKKGEILAEIVKPNIPVMNGVVHLISQPLAVFDRVLKPFPYLSVLYKIEADPELNVTYHLGKKGRINTILKRQKSLYTYFAPKNHAWDNYMGYSTDELVDILSRHLIVSDSRFTMSKLATASLKNAGTILETLGGSLKLNVVYSNGSYFLVWGQKWVKVLRPDYECNDGVVHVIDDVFAAPRKVSREQKTSFWKTLKKMVT